MKWDLEMERSTSLYVLSILHRGYPLNQIQKNFHFQFSFECNEKDKLWTGWMKLKVN